MLRKSFFLALPIVVVSTACASNATRQPARVSAASHMEKSATPTAIGGGPRDEALATFPTAKRKLLAAALVSTSGGNCWDATKHATVIDDLTDENGTPFVLPTDLAFDLDGDGRPDPVLEVDSDGFKTRYELYVAKIGCAEHRSSLSVRGRLRAAKGFTKGMRNLELEAPCDVDCCPETKHTDLVWDGAKFVEGKSWTTPNACK